MKWRVTSAHFAGKDLVTGRADQDRFAELFTQHQASLYGYVYSLVPNRSDAEEIFNESVLVLWKKWDHYDVSRSFMAWARGIAYNEVRNYLRKNARREQYMPDEVLDALAEEAVESESWLAARSRALVECLEKLLPDERRLIDLCYLAGNTFRSVAEKLGRHPDAVYKQLQRLRKRLFVCVEEVLAREDDE